jgi:pimeloyl-ACP methyl ester carboxylesterase
MKRIPFFDRPTAMALDFGMCLAMNAVQWRHRLHAGSRADLEKYIAQCETLTPEEFYGLPAVKIDPGTGNASLDASYYSWPSPVRTPYPENNRTHVDLFPCASGWRAPTVILLHALMSTSDTGYRQWAGKFNELGWNACFVHLPYHYSRRPRGFMNGELAISADLVRTAEGLRQGVLELRQLMGHLRGLGCREFGLWASSYGAWIGALLGFVERDFRFLALMEAILNIEHAIWEGAASVVLRRELRRSGIDHPLVERHFHLTSPIRNFPLCGGKKVLFASGDYDRIAPHADIESLHRQWSGSELLRVPQGHFGNRMMPAVFERLRARGDV